MGERCAGGAHNVMDVTPSPNHAATDPTTPRADHPRIGAHCSTAAGIDQAIRRAAEMGCASVQIFGSNPRQWKARRHPAVEIRAWQAARAVHDVGPVYSHAIYLVNLASPDRRIWRASIRSLIAGRRICASLHLAGLICHVGSHLGRGFVAALPRIRRALEQILADSDSDVPLVLENSAGARNVVGASLGELGAIIDALHGDPRLRICLDSAHAFASGYDLRRSPEVERLVEDVRTTVGADRLSVLHLNDSKTGLGSNRDRHANLGEGEIGLDGLRNFLIHPGFAGLPALLETPGFDGTGPDRFNVEIALALVGAGRYTPRGALRRARRASKRAALGRDIAASRNQA